MRSMRRRRWPAATTSSGRSLRSRRRRARRARDLIDRYRPLVMGNPQFQESGIMPACWHAA